MMSRGFLSGLRLVPLVTAWCLCTAAARAQLTADRLYYGVHRPIPVIAHAPADASGPLSLRLIRVPGGEVEASAAIDAGPIDLAAAFPALWAKGDGPPRVRGVQLAVGELAVGPMLVLQPMVDPPYAAFIESGEPRYRPSTGAFSGYRVYLDRRVVLETSKGSITIALRPDAAPNTAWNFRHLAEGGLYTDVAFHRVRPTHPSGAGFVIEAGDPTQTPSDAPPTSAEAGPGYTINLEPSPLPHDFGVVSMSRRQNLPNSAGSRFFIALSRVGTAHLDGQFASFGEVVEGADVVRAIAAAPTGEGDRPLEPIVIRAARLVDAPPLGLVRAAASVDPARAGVPRAAPDEAAPEPPSPAPR